MHAGTGGFWAMGGYADYVWPSYALAVAVLIWNWLSPRLKRRSLLRELGEELEASSEVRR